MSLLLLQLSDSSRFYWLLPLVSPAASPIILRRLSPFPISRKYPVETCGTRFQKSFPRQGNAPQPCQSVCATRARDLKFPRTVRMSSPLRISPRVLSCNFSPPPRTTRWRASLSTVRFQIRVLTSFDSRDLYKTRFPPSISPSSFRFLPLTFVSSTRTFPRVRFRFYSTRSNISLSVRASLLRALC